MESVRVPLEADHCIESRENRVCLKSIAGNENRQWEIETLA